MTCLLVFQPFHVGAFLRPCASSVTGFTRGISSTAPLFASTAHLRGLIEEIQDTARKNPLGRQTIFVGGKGGVGKVQ